MEHPEGKKRRGRPPGIARVGKYGTGVKTKTVRVPVAIADNIQDILAKFEDIRALVDDWEERVETSGLTSSVNRPSPRYERAAQLLEDLRGLLD
jgi:hypothetical protein